MERTVGQFVSALRTNPGMSLAQRLRTDWLALWLKDPQRVQPGTRMPTNFPAKAEENAFPEVLGGDQQKQVEAVRAYLLTLAGPRAN